MLLLQNGPSSKLFVRLSFIFSWQTYRYKTAMKRVAGSDDHDTHLSCHHLWLECSSFGGRLPQIHVLSKGYHPNCQWPLPVSHLVSVPAPPPPVLLLPSACHK